MDYRLDYISRLFEKTSKKRIETYVISRIWHKLDNSDVKIIPQQYVNRNKEKYALTDLYLPQIGLHIEINEPAHYESAERIEIDRLRKEEIEKRTNQTVETIDCRKSLDEIHSQIETVVNLIQKKVLELKKIDKFKPWLTENEFSPVYHKQKGILKVEDEPCFRTIEDICELFNVKVPKRGFLRKGGVGHPTENDLIVWWPSASNRIWENEISEDGTIIIERNREIEKRKSHVEYYIKNPIKRATFFCQTDVLGFKFYRFKGIFELDLEQTKPEKGLVWIRNQEFIKL